MRSKLNVIQNIPRSEVLLKDSLSTVKLKSWDNHRYSRHFIPGGIFLHDRGPALRLEFSEGSDQTRGIPRKSVHNVTRVKYSYSPTFQAIPFLLFCLSTEACEKKNK